MAVVLSDRIYTVEDYMKLDDGQRYELIGGNLIMVPSPSTNHQRITGKIYRLLSDFAEKKQLGEVFDAPMDVVLDNQVIQPDIFYISKDRSSIIGELNIQGAPDLVVEVLSPSTAAYDRKKKSRLYFKHGVKEYWLVDPDVKFVDVYVAGEKEWLWIGAFDQEDVLTTALLPGLEISLAEVFKGLK
ncbi:Uma2 family endonuclease [Desulforamulus putei]|uniref:Endonuclease, Uma2 family (Restriction endonuclease fold) n=1 Tax=Desulforamulus putei DSM 12395 TaxID=1121429 RepID=A0A1M4T3W2_9FIRM|nr:Uma2 family endonuclease [Desulforamulus putei]SHE39104.1 Endonuclease, Uma2 family (restriction endonuclease fold) [Desulforamulus putei DSM 12395]